MREQQSLYDATEVLIEDKASGTQLIQETVTPNAGVVASSFQSVDYPTSANDCRPLLGKAGEAAAGDRRSAPLRELDATARRGQKLHPCRAHFRWCPTNREHTGPVPVPLSPGRRRRVPR